MSDIVERLRATRPFPSHYKSEAVKLINPDGPEAVETILALRARVAELEGFLGFVETSNCNYCGASVALMGADFLEGIMGALDKAGAPRKSPDGMIHYSMFDRIAALATEQTP